MLLTVLSLTLLASCGGGGGGGSKSDKTTSPLSKSGVGNASSEVFMGDCRYDSGMDKYVKNVVTITRTEAEPIVILSDDLYVDSSCKRLKLSIDYPVLNVNMDETRIAGDTYGVSFRPRSKDIVKEMNNEVVCGNRGWRLNQAQDVTNTSCGSSLSGHVSIELNDKSATVKLCPSNQRTCAQMILQRK